LSNRLREKYAQEMTIVLQHQFWDLGVTEHAFEIGLSFSGVPERLLIPFDALTGFFDPSVQFGLKFDTQEDEDEEEIVEAPPAPAPVRTGDTAPVELKQPRKAPEKKAEPDKVKPSPVPAEATAETDHPQKTETGEGQPGSAEVVSLDAFRKKN
jgi:hypothetical protein